MLVFGGVKRSFNTWSCSQNTTTTQNKTENTSLNSQSGKIFPKYRNHTTICQIYDRIEFVHQQVISQIDHCFYHLSGGGGFEYVFLSKPFLVGKNMIHFGEE